MKWIFSGSSQVHHSLLPGKQHKVVIAIEHFLPVMQARQLLGVRGVYPILASPNVVSTSLNSFHLLEALVANKETLSASAFTHYLLALLLFFL